MRENLETGALSSSTFIQPGQDATFRAFLGRGKVLRFTLNLKKMEELAPIYQDSHKLPELEEDAEKWFSSSSEHPLTRKLRGAPLRWWCKRAVVPAVGVSFHPRKKRVVKDATPHMAALDV